MIEQFRTSTLAAVAAPSCRECEQPITRVESTWTHEHGKWSQTMVMVCPNEHRTGVAPFE